MNTEAFAALLTEYQQKLKNFTQAMEREVSTYARDLPIGQARTTVQARLDEAIGQWLENTAQAYALDLRQAARKEMGEQVGQREDLFALEEGLDRAINEALGRLTVPSGKLPPLDVPSPYTKPAVIAGAAGGAAILMATILKGLCLFLVEVAVIAGGTVVAWKVFQEQIPQTRRQLEEEAHKFLDHFQERVSAYLQQATEAAAAAFDSYTARISAEGGK